MDTHTRQTVGAELIRRHVREAVAREHLGGYSEGSRAELVALVSDAACEAGNP